MCQLSQINHQGCMWVSISHTRLHGKGLEREGGRKYLGHSTCLKEIGYQVGKHPMSPLSPQAERDKGNQNIITSRMKIKEKHAQHCTMHVYDILSIPMYNIHALILYSTHVGLCY